MSSRVNIHYWKCDRASAFTPGAVVASERMRPGLGEMLEEIVRVYFGAEATHLEPGPGQGNHLTYLLKAGASEYFIRIEDGPEGDDYLEVESQILQAVVTAGVPAPRVFHVDATRRHAPFAWQILEKVAQTDLNRLAKAGELDLGAVSTQIGAYVAHWQSVPTRGFGPFDVGILRTQGRLQGLMREYRDYFFLRLDEHLAFLERKAFLSHNEGAEIRSEIERHSGLLDRATGCLVHKDLALWNILGTPKQITAFIDWDDSIAGDPLDDLSLLGCFHDGVVIARALEGYASVRPLPEDYAQRFWLHLLRNMLIKSVIRVGAGYFDRPDSFFLVGAGTNLRTFTLARVRAALAGLREAADPVSL